MANNAVDTMGMLLPDDVHGRDAVHVAVISAVAVELLLPGEHVGLCDDGMDGCGDVKAGMYAKPQVGIVDPFLVDCVRDGERFWLFLYPRTITDLRHVWNHPAFPEAARLDPVDSASDEKRASENWLRDFCEVADCPSYARVLAAAKKVADGKVVGWDPDYLHFDGIDAHGDIPTEFWHHVEVVLGRPIYGVRAKHFSCAC